MDRGLELRHGARRNEQEGQQKNRARGKVQMKGKIVKLKKYMNLAGFLQNIYFIFRFYPKTTTIRYW